VKIGIFSNCYLPMVNGVVGTVCLLKKGFEEHGHKVYIFAPNFDDYHDQEEGVFRFPAVDLTKKVKYPIAIPFSPRINRVLKDLKLDIIHCHHPFVLGPLGHKIARRQEIPVVYTFHTQYEQYSHYIPFPEQMVNRFSRRQIHKFCQAVDRITTPAESARQLLLNYGVTNPITVLPNPTLLASQTGDGAVVRHQYNLQQEKLLINIGRIAPEKNLELLLKAFRQMLDHTGAHTLKLMIVGEGPELPNLRQIAIDLSLDRDVIFAGLVPPAVVPDYLDAADLFMMTSFSEVKPLSQLEALAAGLPIVSVRAPGANDTIIDDQNGLLVNPDPETISAAVLSLLADEARLARYQEGARQSAAAYSHSKIAATYLDLFVEAIQIKAANVQ
jgi:1,2-diacylglycerol 3-alpha-glucosyltransferase